MNLRQIAFLAIKGIISEMNNRDPHKRAVAVLVGLDLTHDAARDVVELVEEYWETFPGYSRESEIFEIVLPALVAHVATLA